MYMDDGRQRRRREWAETWTDRRISAAHGGVSGPRKASGSARVSGNWESDEHIHSVTVAMMSRKN